MSRLRMELKEALKFCESRNYNEGARHIRNLLTPGVVLAQCRNHAECGHQDDGTDSTMAIHDITGLCYQCVHDYGRIEYKHLGKRV